MGKYFVIVCNNNQKIKFAKFTKAVMKQPNGLQKGEGKKEICLVNFNGIFRENNKYQIPSRFCKIKFRGDGIE